MTEMQLKRLWILGVLASVLTLSADMAAGFWSPGLEDSFWKLVSAHSDIRIQWASLGNLFTLPLHLCGIWLLYLAMRPAGFIWSVAPLVWLTVSLFAVPQFIHAAWWFLADAGSYFLERGEAGSLLLMRHEEITRDMLSVFRVQIVLFSLWITWPIAKGLTLLPRYMALAPYLLAPPVIARVAMLWPEEYQTAFVHALGGPFILGVFYTVSFLSLKKELRPCQQRA